MDQNLLLVWVSIAFLWINIAQADPVKGLYEATVAVQGQSAEDRAEAITEAFSLVLVKISGSREVGKRSDILNSAQRYVEQYRYQWVENQQNPSVLPKRALWVKFDKIAVDRYLLELGLSVWGGSRPTILFWVGVDQSGVRSLLNEEGRWQKIQAIGKIRGVPSLFPLMDLQDQSAMQFSDLWGDFEETIRSASTRYDPDGILVSRITRFSNTSWSGRWTLYLGDEPIRWEASDLSYDKLLKTGIGLGMDYIAQQYSARVDISENTRPYIIVSDLVSLTDYARATQFLSQLTQVEKIQPVTFSGNRVKFLVTLVGSSESLVNAIQIGDVLDYVPSVDNSLDLNFVLIP